MQFELQLEEAKIKLKAEHMKVKASTSAESSSASRNIEGSCPNLQSQNSMEHTLIGTEPKFWGNILKPSKKQVLLLLQSFPILENYYVRKLSIYSRRVQQGGCYSEGQIWKRQRNYKISLCEGNTRSSF